VPLVAACGLPGMALSVLTHTLWLVFWGCDLLLASTAGPSSPSRSGGMTHTAATHQTSMGSTVADGVLDSSAPVPAVQSLISTYLIYKGRASSAVPARDPPHPVHLVSTFDLLMSSLMMVLALAAVSAATEVGEDWLFSTALLGLVFLGGQVIEFTEFVHKADDEHQPVGCTFFVLTGTHGAHVAVGVLWLLTLWYGPCKASLGPQRMTVEITGCTGIFPGCGVDRNLHRGLPIQ